jgi:hypothetical protein
MPPAGILTIWKRPAREFFDVGRICAVFGRLGSAFCAGAAKCR